MEKLDSKPIVSIIIPMYNVESYIAECIESLKMQTYANFQCLLVDDGSIDNTVSRVSELVGKDIRFQLRKQKNSGPAKARNTGLLHVEGEYTLFVDSDDKLAPETLSILVNAAIENNSEIVLGKTLRFNQTKEWEVKSHEKHDLVSGVTKKLDSHPELFYALGPAAKLFRTDLIKSLSFDETKQFAEDQLFVLSAYVKAKEIMTVKDVVYYYRVREKEDSLTQKYKKKPVENLNVFLTLMNEAQKLIEEDSLEMLKAYYNRLFEIELRVLFKNILLSRKKEQINFYSSFTVFLEKNKELISTCTNYYDYIIKEQLMYFFLVKGEAVDYLVEIIKLSLNKTIDGYEEMVEITTAGKWKRQLLKLKAVIRKVIVGR